MVLLFIVIDTLCGRKTGALTLKGRRVSRVVFSGSMPVRERGAAEPTDERREELGRRLPRGGAPFILWGTLCSG
ncbi:MAG: hypothetical protein U0X91_31010 [Spirosomataceae bacterium]